MINFSTALLLLLITCLLSHSAASGNDKAIANTISSPSYRVPKFTWPAAPAAATGLGSCCCCSTAVGR